MNQRPALDEMDPYFHGYFGRVPAEETRLDDALESARAAGADVLSRVDEARGASRYAEGKWSIKEIVAHLIDCERIFCTRALAFARRDPTALPGFDHEAYVKVCGADRRPLADLLAEFDVVRAATRAMFRSFDDETLRRRGVANGAEISVRALGFILAGHERHHTAVIAERYL